MTALDREALAALDRRVCHVAATARLLCYAAQGDVATALDGIAYTLDRIGHQLETMAAAAEAEARS